MEEKDRLQDIPQFSTLEMNLELRVALQQVDKLKAENVSLKEKINTLETSLDTAVKEYYSILTPDYDEDINMNELNEQSVQNEEEEMPESLQKGIDEYDYEAACLQAELEEAKEEDDLFKDWTPPSYEDVVDPEFDRGFKMGQDWLIDDIIKYLENIRKNGEA